MTDDTEDEKQLLQDIADAQKEFYSNLSDALEALSDADPEPYSKIVLKVAGWIPKLASLFTPDPIASAIGALFDKLHELYVVLSAADAATQLLAKKTFLNNAAQNANTALDDLKLVLNGSTTFSPGDIIINCQSSLNAFLNEGDLIWNSTYSAADAQKIYWTDEGRQSTCYILFTTGIRPVLDDAAYGAQEPSLNDDRITVFDYRMSLPVYLWILNIYLAVGLALDPNFRDDMKGDLANAVQQLQSIHDKVVNEGLTLLSPPDWTATSIQETACPQDPTDPARARPAIQLQYDKPFDPHHPANPKTIGAAIEYEVVEKFSGITSIDDAYQLDLTMLAPNDAASYHKLQARLLKRKKDVYVTCGMNAAFHAINRLSVLTGSPIPNARSMADWSLREVLGISQIKTGALRDLAGFLVRTQPFDTPYTASFPNVTVSLRQLLTVPTA